MKRLRVYFNSSAPATRMLVNYDKFGPVPPPREFRHSAPAPLEIRGKCPRQAQKHLVSLSFCQYFVNTLFAECKPQPDHYCNDQQGYLQGMNLAETGFHMQARDPQFLLKSKHLVPVFLLKNQISHLSHVFSDPL